MVMATDTLDSGQETENEEREVIGEAAVLHEQLVRHVLTVTGELESRSEVLGEHSYAKAQGPATGAQIRSLLPELEPEPDDEEPIDVESVPHAAPPPPCDSDSDSEPPSAPEQGDDWEERLAALAPSPALAELARSAASALQALRLERLAGARGRWARREGARAAARRLRRALAPHWAGGAGWLHAALGASLPPAPAALYAELVAELRRAAPRLAARLPAPPAHRPFVDPLDVVGEPRDASAPGPWLAWAPSGSEREDARWLRRLGALVHTRVLRAAPPAPPAPSSPAAPPAPASPDRWCAALAHEARGALGELLGEAGRRAVVLGGAGAGAALAGWLAGGGAGARVRGLLLLAPPLLTAEGARDRPDDVLRSAGAPLLAVAGGGAAQCWRGAAADVACAGERRRVLLLAGADDALRLPRAHRRRRRLPQEALDAAIAEESVRWAWEVTDTRRREEETRTAGGNRSIEIIEGRVVSRVLGASPLALAPPRRADALVAADIMTLPIVFADDEPPALTVTSAPPGGAAPHAAPPAAPGAAPPGARLVVARRGARGGRPLVVRRRAPPAHH